jgi:hypothetical protein
MAERRVSVLMGIGELVVMESVKAVLTHHYHDRAMFDFVVSSGLDDFIHDASTGNYAIAFLAPNCFLRSQPEMLEQSISAVRTMKATSTVPLVILAPMEKWLEPLRSAGADVCLHTPFTLKELIGAVSGFVESRP